MGRPEVVSVSSLNSSGSLKVLDEIDKLSGSGQFRSTTRPGIKTFSAEALIFG